MWHSSNLGLGRQLLTCGYRDIDEHDRMAHGGEK
jgi:hypothetical protein